MSQHLCQSDTCISQSAVHDKAVVVGIYGTTGSGESVGSLGYRYTTAFHITDKLNFW